MHLSAPLRAHSKSFLKRKAGHPARWPATAAAEAVPPPAYTSAPLTASSSSGWLPRRDPSDVLPQSQALPFRVERSSVGGNVPVYLDFLSGRTKTVTLIRKVQGDASALGEEVRRVTGGAAVKVFPGSRVQVEGDWREQLRIWLMGLGM